MPREGVVGAGVSGVPGAGVPGVPGAPVPGVLSPPPPPQAAKAVEANSAVSRGAWARLLVAVDSVGRGWPSGASATAVVRVSSYGCVMVVVIKSLPLAAQP